MDSSLTISETRLPCPPCGKMGLQPWTVVVAINQMSNLDLDRSWQYGGYVVELPPLKLRFDTAEMPKLFVLLPRKWPVQMMGEIMRLCLGDAS